MSLSTCCWAPWVLPGPEKLFDPNWFILKNFHGQFYADGDKLEEYLHFRENLPIQDYFNRLADHVEFYFKIPRYLPKNLVAACAKPFMRRSLPPRISVL